VPKTEKPGPGDMDGDGILDDVDKCPRVPEDMDGYQDDDGCPEDDNDADGIADKIDKCPNDPETANNYQDLDGCPDQLPEKLAKFIGKIEGIRFAPNRAVLLPQSFSVLDKAVEALQENAAVRVEISGHTDNIGAPG
jgi:OOP family OmpA-OmpF porin